MTSSNGKPSNSKPILTGNTVLDKLLNQLSQADREFVLRLMTEMGIRPDDPMHPFLVALQYYVTLLKEIPASMRAAADDSLIKAVAAYGSIQTEIENSIGDIRAIKSELYEDTAALLPQFQSAFDEANKTAESAYKTAIRKASEDYLKEWGENLKSTKDFYLKDVLKQGLIWATGVSVTALVAVGGSAYFWGSQSGYRSGYNSAVQDVYSAFGGKRGYECAKAVWRDNTFQCKNLPQ